MIGKANAASPVLYQRGLNKRGIGFDGNNTLRRRIPEELIKPKAGGESEKTLHFGDGSSILNAGGMPAKTGVSVIDEALEKVNPSGDMRNCGPCAIAYELRRRGKEVEARAISNMRTTEFGKYFEGFTWDDVTAKNNVEAQLAVTKKIKAMGDGARGVVFGAWGWPDATGHYFSFEVHKGQILLTDAQKGDGNVKRYFKEMKHDCYRVARLDNLKPKKEIKHIVKGDVKGI